MASRRVLVRLAPLLSLLGLLFNLDHDAAAEQLLLNGGFEQGSAGWTNLSTEGCPAHEGNAAAALVTSADEQVDVLSQTVGIGGGPFTLSGYARRLSGSPALSVQLSWRSASGQQLNLKTRPLTAGGAYTAFNLSEPGSPANTASLRISFTVSAGGPSTVCLDDIELDAAPPGTPTPSPSPTPTTTPTATETAVPLAGATETPVPTADAGSTPTPGAAATGGPATATPSSQSSAGATSDQDFRNGGFEDGTEGWQKFGGELRSVSSPKRSGEHAGAFVSSTSSTKWAYQVVAVDPALAYEFSGYLHTAGAVSEAYLRISWYGSADGSGQAVATDDSTSRLNGAGDAFVFLTTGAVRPPSGARSARPRVMLAPAGSETATLYLDDFDFVTTTAAAGAPPRPNQTDAEAQPDEDDSPDLHPTQRAAATVSPLSAATADRTPTAVSEVASRSRTEPVRGLTPVAAPGSPQDPADGNGSSLVWPAAIVVALIGLASAFLYSRHNRP